MDCFRYLEIGRLGGLESFLKFSPTLPDSEPPSSESKEGVLKLPQMKCEDDMAACALSRFCNCRKGEARPL